ncbi:type II CAAX endopeptidase family protein [Marispirochaeta aestuarii]|uniref:CPBP family intramembrane glutamic endopeptidase n=1 Tax=Marispirochaeta aestuarii TaxID=1963862 RepID=UPI0029C6D227|nr:type II CAAX endopeptidase family protein [Marispirochaeta aestuarii]
MSKDYNGFSRILPNISCTLRYKKSDILELILLFAAFFLPGYIFQNQEVDPLIFNSAGFHGMYLLQTLPMIALLLFLLFRKGHHWWVPYRLTSIHWKDIPFGILSGIAVWAALLPLLLISSLFLSGPTEDAVGIDWKLQNAAMLPLVLITSLTTGYWEELFFRSYLDGQLRKIGLSRAWAAVIGIVLFASGHLYQGSIPALGTALIGAVLLFIFRYRRSLHTVALGHGLYNFSVLLLSLVSDFG